jgi:hypothetical protein
MRFLIIFLTVFCYNSSFGQKVISVAPNTKNVRPGCPNLFKYQPMLFVDSMHVPLEMLSKLNPNDIQEVSVVKNGYDSISKTDGKIYVFMKKGKSIKLFDFASFKLKYLSNSAKPILLMLNSVFIKDYTNFVIDEKTIAKVEIDKGADIEPLKNIYPNNCIVNILTNESFNRNSVSQVLLNGAALNK